ncbi:MAG: antibiotic biosynthesis monooxygenase [Rhodobacteraceae bacterium]|nr:antibiotic biosynthesis monooxygenase [Paracoccaceae bacterium]
MTQPLCIIATITPRPEHLEDARKAILGVISQTVSEAGCRTFRLLEGNEDANLYLYEEWDDQAALDAHYAQPYIKTVFEAYQRWLAKPVDIIRLQRLA